MGEKNWKIGYRTAGSVDLEDQQLGGSTKSRMRGRRGEGRPPAVKFERSAGRHMPFRGFAGLEGGGESEPSLPPKN